MGDGPRPPACREIQWAKEWHSREGIVSEWSEDFLGLVDDAIAWRARHPEAAVPVMPASTTSVVESCSEVSVIFVDGCLLSSLLQDSSSDTDNSESSSSGSESGSPDDDGDGVASLLRGLSPCSRSRSSREGTPMRTVTPPVERPWISFSETVCLNERPWISFKLPSCPSSNNPPIPGDVDMEPRSTPLLAGREGGLPP